MSLSDWWANNAPSWLGGSDPSSFPTPPVPEVGATSSPGGTAYDPTVASPSNWGSTSSPTDWTKVASALKDLGSSDKSSTGSDTGSSKISSGGTSQVQSTVGRPAAAVSMDNLMKALQSRQQMYAQSAMSPTTAAPQTQKQTSYGLLGY